MHDSDDHGWLKQGSTSADEVRQTYDDWAAGYDDDLAGWDYHAPAEAAAMLRKAVPLSGAILDAGCGTGLSGQALREAGFGGPIDGVDLSPASLEVARRRGVYRDLSPANLQELPLARPADSYDGLICIGVLTYVPDSEAVLREFARLVRPGGAIVLTQREDVFAERDFGGTIARLRAAGVFTEATVTEPHPYLPGNPDFGTETLVVFARLTVA